MIILNRLAIIGKISKKDLSEIQSITLFNNAKLSVKKVSKNYVISCNIKTELLELVDAKIEIKKLTGAKQVFATYKDAL
jgi:hypothetical protein